MALYVAVQQFWKANRMASIFGFRSRDPKVVYIRNKKLHTDFEVCHHEGSYAESVHGIVQERPKEKVRKMPRE